MSSQRNSNKNKYGDKYSINQCSLMVRVDDQELEVPLNFGMTSEEIKRIYPFLLQFAAVPIKNPAVSFGLDDKHGKFVDMSEEELERVMKKTNDISRYWYGKSEASLLDIAVRFALDIQLRGIDELVDLFTPISPLEMFERKDVEPLTDEEAEAYIMDTGLETEVDHEHDPGDEHDIPLGVAGELHVNLYDSGIDEDYLSDELDVLESKISPEDQFEKVISKDISINESDYKSHYNSGKLDESDIHDGLLVMYDQDNESRSIFDDMDAEDGLVLDESTDLNATTDSQDVGKYVDSDFDSTDDSEPVSLDDDEYDWEVEDEDFDENGEN